MPGLNGAQAVEAIKSRRPNAKIYMITAYPGDALVQSALDAGAEGVMKKPFDIAKVLDLMKD
jgi:DNA-binding NarL/FixJ family response regulator